MAVTETSKKLESIVEAIRLDTGLKSETSTANINEGIKAARLLNEVLGEVIEKFNFNSDNMITAAEMKKISDEVRATPLLHYNFIQGHGDDAGNVETGYHKLQNNGGDLEFQGRNFLDTVIDAIYHFGEEYVGNNFLNEDGNLNETVADIAGWLNYFLNGKTIKFGGSANDMLGSGDYSSALSAASHETFYGYAGDDKIWSGTGNDTVYAGIGNDEAGGGTGHDKMYGDEGADTLYGEDGNDTISGGVNNDKLNGGAGNDKIYGDSGSDEIWGDVGDDVIDGGGGHDVIGGGDGKNTLSGNDGKDQINGGSGYDRIDGGADDDVIYGADGRDVITGGDGNDKADGATGDDYLVGGLGNDTLSAGEGTDVINGGDGADKIFLYAKDSGKDTLVFMKGDSGRTSATIDVVEGFVSGQDKIDLRALGKMTFEDLDFEGGGKASVYYDGRYLRIDHTGDGATDMIIQFKWVEDMSASDFLFAA
jgi:Ca2+-binding RTX toxin-like protein